MKRTTILMAAFLCLFSLTESPAQNTRKNMEQLNLTQEWDKTFPKSDKVNHSKVTFNKSLRYHAHRRPVCTENDFRR